MTHKVSSDLKNVHVKSSNLRHSSSDAYCKLFPPVVASRQASKLVTVSSMCTDNNDNIQQGELEKSRERYRRLSDGQAPLQDRTTSRLHACGPKGATAPSSLSTYTSHELKWHGSASVPRRLALSGRPSHHHS